MFYLFALDRQRSRKIAVLAVEAVTGEPFSTSFYLLFSKYQAGRRLRTRIGRANVWDRIGNIHKPDVGCDHRKTGR